MKVLLRGPPPGDLVVADFRISLSVDIICLLVYSLSLVIFMYMRKCPRLDSKTWTNIIVNLLSFTTKTLIWTWIMIIYDKAEENKIGKE